ncbi:dihydrofolate reductase-like domain-containing protein, partial [Paraphysoderma sedebokerense]
RPWVTLTYAQSIDGFIAGEGGQQVRISGNESMAMTHLLRNNHDAILVGIGTLLNDNPRLTVRFPTDTKVAMPEIRHPQPIVLDSKLRIPLDCNLVLQPSQNNAFKSPWVITSHQRYELWNSSKLEGLSLKGVKVLQCNLDANGNLDLPDVLSVLYKEGVRSVMVEGGSQVIDSFLRAAS